MIYAVIVLNMLYTIDSSFITMVCTFAKKPEGYFRASSILSPGFHTHILLVVFTEQSVERPTMHVSYHVYDRYIIWN